MITPKRRTIWILTMLAFLAMTTGCTQTNLKLVEDEIEQMDSEIHKEKGQKIEGYHLRNGTVAEYKGRVHLAGQDSLRFWREVDSGGLGISYVRGPLFEAGDVKAFEVKESDVGSTILLLVPILLVGVLIVGYATMEYEFE